jgi:hypothetical protein
MLQNSRNEKLPSEITCGQAVQAAVVEPNILNPSIVQEKLLRAWLLK